MSDLSRFLGQYAKLWNAGGFATPGDKELAGMVSRVWTREDGKLGFAVVGKMLNRPSRRHDWCGRQFELPQGILMATHVARRADTEVPDLTPWDVITSYVDDLALTRALHDQGRVRIATRISAAGELLGLWGRAGSSGLAEDTIDRVTMGEVPLTVPDETRAAVLSELARIEGWTDDYPYYSDGSWSALSLRGFRADDPAWGVKPAEMSRKWKADHPEAMEYRCRWTVLADACPATRGLVESVADGSAMERVRFLRMGRGNLARHTDITDRAQGTRLGQIVRYHVPLVTDRSVTMATWGLDGQVTRAHLEPWHAYYLDARKPHAVSNPVDLDRVHLTIDLVVDARVQAAILALA